MLCHTTWLITKIHPGKYIFEKPSLSERVARWQVQLSEYDIQYVLSKAIKGSAIADFLAERALEDYKPINFDFPDEDLMAVSHDKKGSSQEIGWKLYFNEASNALGHRIEAVLVTLKGEYCPFTTRLDFNCTNNMAKYEACFMGLPTAIDKRVKELDVYGDLALIIYQLRGE